MVLRAKVLVTEDDDAATRDEDGELVALSGGELAELQPADVRASERGDLMDSGRAEQVGKRVGERVLDARARVLRNQLCRKVKRDTPRDGTE